MFLRGTHDRIIHKFEEMLKKCERCFEICEMMLKAKRHTAPKYPTV